MPVEVIEAVEARAGEHNAAVAASGGAKTDLDKWRPTDRAPEFSVFIRAEHAKPIRNASTSSSCRAGISVRVVMLRVWRAPVDASRTARACSAVRLGPDSVVAIRRRHARLCRLPPAG